MIQPDCCILVVAVLLTLVVSVRCEVDADGIAVFKYKLYPYKKKQQIENMFKARSEQCQQMDECLAEGLESIERVHCIRHCISPPCYEQLYEDNELEPGEIDVRVGSFKGCLQQEITNKHVGQRLGAGAARVDTSVLDDTDAL